MIPCPTCRHAVTILATSDTEVTVDCLKCGLYTIPRSAMGATPYLGDQITRDPQGRDFEINFSPADDEPRLNAWMDVTCQTPDGEETVSFMYFNGAYGRDHIFADYVEGGHFYRYGWIAEPHIFIEDIMSIIDQVCTGCHEIHERYRMKYLGWTYEKAHRSAVQIERKLREILLSADTILPSCDDIRQMFSLEGSGQTCEDFAREAMKKNHAKAKVAAKQANNPVGHLDEWSQGEDE